MSQGQNSDKGITLGCILRCSGSVLAPLNLGFLSLEFWGFDVYIGLRLGVGSRAPFNY